MGVATARDTLAALAKKLENQRSVDIIIEQRLHSLLIGQGGATVRDIISKFNGLSVEFPAARTASDIIKVRGG